VSRIKITIGKKEKHTVEVTTSWTARVALLVDNLEVADTRLGLNYVNKTLRATIGNKEKHELEVRAVSKPLGIKLMLLVDDKLTAES
jgi:hypothetical protein